MRSVRALGTIAIVAAALIVAIGPTSARAASTVDVTYNLSDTSLGALLSGSNVLFISNDDPVNGTISGSMKVRYASNNQSSIPIQPGSASLLSFNLTVSNFTIKRYFESGTQVQTPVFPYMSANLHWQLTGGPLGGSLTSGGALTGLAGGIKLTGTAKCLFPPPYSAYCGPFLGLPSPGVTANISRSYSGPISLGGSIGPQGGAASTPHTLTGSAPISLAQGLFLRLGANATHNGYGGVQIVGREIRREAEGHPPKPIPEPGTLLLLGAGAAGLALVSRATRRSRQR